MKSKSFQGQRGGVAIAGGRTGILLFHSLGGSPLELKFVATSLAQKGHTVYCPIIPGLSYGTDVSGMSTWQDWSRAADKAFDDLRAYCDTIIVGGASAGSVLALQLAARRADNVKGVVLFAPTLVPNGWSIPWTIHLFRLVRMRWFARLFTFQMPSPHGIKDERVRKFAVESARSGGEGGLDITRRPGVLVFEFMRLVRNVRPMLKSIAQHTLIFHPREDDQSDLRNSVALQRRLGGLVEMCILNDSYHMVTLDKQRGVVAERTVSFVDRILNSLPADAADSGRGGMRPSSPQVGFVD